MAHNKYLLIKICILTTLSYLLEKDIFSSLESLTAHTFYELALDYIEWYGDKHYLYNKNEIIYV